MLPLKINIHGHAKIYKSKKKIEIRFRKSILKSKFIDIVYVHFF